LKLPKFAHIQKRVRHATRLGIVGAYKLQEKALINPIYVRLFAECDRIAKDDVDWKSWKYWQETVVEKFFGKNVKGGYEAMDVQGKELHDWLIGFSERLRVDCKASSQDKAFLQGKFVPYMKVVQESGNDLNAVLDHYGLLKDLEKDLSENETEEKPLVKNDEVSK